MYYRLTYIATSDKERQGDYIHNGFRPLNIGQGTACVAQLPDSDMYEAQIFATVLPRENADGWYLVRRTDTYRVLVNGIDVPIVTQLHTGDQLTFDDASHQTVLKFETYDDGDYEANSGVVYKNHVNHKPYFLTAVLVALIAIGVSVAVLYQYTNRTMSIRNMDLSSYNEYVYRITVDSVSLLYDHSGGALTELETVEAVELEKVAVGTAFLTQNGLMVTARHCIEPWLDDTDWDGSLDEDALSPEMKLALRAETENQKEGAGNYIVRSHCIVTKGLIRYEKYSTDFHMNKSRDLILPLGSFEDPVYWRTITPLGNNREMELGDFAYLIIDSLYGQSPLSLANEKDMEQLGRSGNGREIEISGYPLLDDSNWDEVNVMPGSIMASESKGERFRYSEECLPLSGNINRGNSGGPVLALVGKEVKVVGIVSKVDGHADNGVFWAVSVTEVLNLQAYNDTITYDKGSSINSFFIKN